MLPGERLFSFAVIADTHVNQEEGRASSDFAVNRLSNARNRHVMHAVNAAKPDFVLHLGDIVHPTPGHPAYAEAAKAFHELAALLECPLYLTPGNHDVGDKPGDWLPVPSVNEGYLELYRQHFGANYHSFDAHGCHFVVIDAQLVNSGLPAEAQQRAWLEADLEASGGKRTFLATHYPPYVFAPAEGGHYDNLDEPGRAWLLGLVARYRVEAVFAGHVHNFWYHRLGATEIYLLPSTAFVRLDYSEMYRIEPGPERGRNDAAKLGFLLVDVHERGHVAHPVRTLGQCQAPDAATPAANQLAPVHPRTLARAPLGIDLRHAWAEVTDVAASGAVDEFSRKTVRNDYPLMALWEMGIRRLRVPVADLRDVRTRERMDDMVRCGHEFTVHSHGAADASLRELFARHGHLVAAWEVIAPAASIAELTVQVASVRAGHAFPVRWSRLRRPEDAVHHGQKARHVIEHGFDLAQAQSLEEMFARACGMREAFDGVVFRVPRDRASWADIAAIDSLGARLALRLEAMVRLAADNPALAPEDELDAANRVAATLLAAHACRHAGVWLDTFADVDRGYFPRAGLVDRRYNPQMAGRACRNLNSILGPHMAVLAPLGNVAFDGGQVLRTSAGDQQWALVLPDQVTHLGAFAFGEVGAPARELRWIDLSTGTDRTVSVQQAEQISCAGPVMVGWEAEH